MILARCRLWVAVLFCVAMLPPITAVADVAEPVTLSVSPDGPLATPAAARDRIRQMRQSGEATGPVTVDLRGGEYWLDQTLVLEAADSGTADAPVLWRAHPGEPVRLIGGKPVGRFQPLTDRSILDRLPEAARPHVIWTDLRSQGITDFGKLAPRGFNHGGPAALELFIDGVRLPLARYPNDGYLTIESLPDGRKGDTLTCANERMKRWTAAPDAWLFGYWYHGWAEQFLPIARIDPDKRLFQVGIQHGSGMKRDQRFFALNLLEEIDSPGEWYLDRLSGRLYLYPPGNLGDAKLIASTLHEPLVRLRDVSYVSIVGLQLEATRGSAVEVRGGQHVTIAGCTIRNTGQRAVSIAGGTKHRIVSCDIYDTGTGGIGLSGGDRKTLAPSGHEAVNNHIHHFGRTERTYRPAVSVWGVGNRAANNLIHDGPHMAVSFGGNDHLIEYNEIHHVLTETDDSGAVYTGRDWTARGTVVQFNYIHHSGPQHATPVPESRRTEPHVVYEPKHLHGTNLLYYDDTAPQITTHGNVLHDGYRGIMIGGGRDHVVTNNVILGGNIGIWIDARGITWAKQHAKRGGLWGIYKNLALYHYDRPPYSTHYPKLATMLDENPAAPWGCVFKRNIVIGAKTWRRFQSYQGEGQTFADNVHDLDIPIAENPIDTLKRIPADVKARIGFEPIPVERIGLQVDEYRPSVRSE